MSREEDPEYSRFTKELRRKIDRVDELATYPVRIYPRKEADGGEDLAHAVEQGGSIEDECLADNLGNISEYLDENQIGHAIETEGDDAPYIRTELKIYLLMMVARECPGGMIDLDKADK